MCTFPSWIEGENGECYFLTDKDVRDHGIDWKDAIGHDAIRKIFPGLKGIDQEGFEQSIPTLLTNAIMKGKCRKIMKASNYTRVTLKNGLLHSFNNLPAIEWTNGIKCWYKNGSFHREDNLPAIERPTGKNCWYKNGIFLYMEKEKNDKSIS